MKRVYFFIITSLLLISVTGCQSATTGKSEHLETEPAAEETARRTETSFYENSWAVVIGINEYEEFPVLEYAVNDARAIEARFRAMGFNVISLQDSRATRENILDVLKNQLPRQVGPNDRLVIFYAGHGAAGVLPTGEEMGFIIPADGKSQVDGRHLEIIGGEVYVEDYQTFPEKANFISVDDIREISDRVKAKHVFYIIDGCYSGFMDPAAYSKINESRRIGRNVKEMSDVTDTERGLFLAIEEDEQVPRQPSPTKPSDYLDVITSRDTVQVLTAGSSGEPVYEKSGHGIFTYYLLRAMDGLADLNKDCVIRSSELGVYVKQIVQEASNSNQSPLFNRISGEGEFIFIPPICKEPDPVHLRPPQPDTSWMETDAYKGPEGEQYKAPSQIVIDNEENLYVLDSERREIYRFDATGAYAADHFEPSGLDEDTWFPTSMAVEYGGNLWVFYTTEDNQKTAAPGKIVIYDQEGHLAENWTGNPHPMSACINKEGSPAGFPPEALIALDIEDNVVMVNQENGVITKCDRSGRLLYQWGDYDAHNIIEDKHRYKTIEEPQGLAVDMFGYVYVTDTEKHRVRKFFDGEWIAGWASTKGKKLYFFDSPHGIEVDRNLYVYVADTKNHRIKKYTSGGEKVLTYWGKDNADDGDKYGEFDEPTDVAVNWESTTVFVADAGNKRIQKFVIE